VRLVLTLLVRDEQDIVADTLDFYLSAGVDHVIATDNASVDRTREILAGYRDRGLLTLIDEPGRDYRQGEWVTRMARLAALEHEADWVLHTDADEFYWPEEGGSLKGALAAVPDDAGSLAVPVVDFRPREEDGRPWWERLTVRETFTRKGRGARLVGGVYKPSGDLCFHTLHRATRDATVARGMHSVAGAGLAQLPGWHPIVTLHFPMRSRAQYVRKLNAGGKPFKPWLADAEITTDAASAFYDYKLIDEAEALAGIRRGEFVHDERIARHLGALKAGGTPPPVGPARGGGALAWPDLPEEVAELRARAAQAAWRRVHSPEWDDVRRLQPALRQLPGRVAERLRERRG
jgi:hypothetical protein